MEYRPSYGGGTVQSRLIGRSAVYMSLSGGTALIHNFERLPLRIQRRVARSAVRKVASRMVKLTKRAIATGTTKAIDSGLLRKSIGFRMWTSKTSQWAVGATIGPRKGFGTLVARNKRGNKTALTKKGIAKVVAGGGTFTRSQYADPAKYAHLVERGRKSSSQTGGVEARPFMGHAYIRSRDYMAGVLRTAIRDGIEREAKKLMKAAAYGR